MKSTLDWANNWKIDRWDRDLSGFCRLHGQHTDRYGDCPMCLMLDHPQLEEKMRGRKSFNQLNREYEDRCLRHYYEDKEIDPRGETEEEYAAYCAEEDRKIQEWEAKRRGE